jgi:hypothetical protein
MSYLVAITNRLSFLANITAVWLAAYAEALDQRAFLQYKCGARRVRVLT